MANAISLASRAVAVMDAVYKANAKSNVFATPAGLVRETNNVGEFQLYEIETSGLKDYDRAKGYGEGSITGVWKTYDFDYDRGIKFNLDKADNLETLNMTLGATSGEFVRTQVVPEADAYTFASIAGTAGIQGAVATLADVDAFLKALLVAKNALDEAEVDETNRVLLATPTLMNGILTLDTTKSRELIASFGTNIAVPQTRFYDAINMTPTGDAGGWARATTGAEINFIACDKNAVLKHDKFNEMTIIDPMANQSADAWLLKFRKYGFVKVLNKKLKGIYVHKKAAPSGG